MPYLLLSTQIRLENGPTIVGDGDIDQDIVNLVGASKVKDMCNDFSHYETPDPVRKVMDTLEKIGYTCIGVTGLGQTAIFTLHKKAE